jgi:hypothetical protein
MSQRPRDLHWYDLPEDEPDLLDQAALDDDADLAIWRTT